MKTKKAAGQSHRTEEKVAKGVSASIGVTQKAHRPLTEKRYSHSRIGGMARRKREGGLQLDVRENRSGREGEKHALTRMFPVSKYRPSYRAERKGEALTKRLFRHRKRKSFRGKNWRSPSEKREGTL